MTVIPLVSPAPQVGSQAFRASQNCFAVPLTLSAHGLPSTPSLRWRVSSSNRAGPVLDVLKISIGSAYSYIEDKLETLVEGGIRIGRDAPRSALPKMSVLYGPEVAAVSAVSRTGGPFP